MKKREKKRLKEAIQKEIAERSDKTKPPAFSPTAKKLPESRGFTARPDKKRG